MVSAVSSFMKTASVPFLGTEEFLVLLLRRSGPTMSVSHVVLAAAEQLLSLLRVSGFLWISSVWEVD